MNQKIIQQIHELRAANETWGAIAKTINSTYGTSHSWQALKAMLKENASLSPFGAGVTIVTGEESPPAPGVNRRGILIIAAGHPYYGELAANLATSLRFCSSDIPIALAWHGKALTHLTPDKLNLFTQLIPIPDEYVYKNGKLTYFKAKTHLYKISPFENTLYLDADMLWLRRDVSTVFEELKGKGFTIQNRGKIDLSGNEGEYHWADWKEIRKAYGFKSGILYGLHSELLYFEKSKETAAFFKTVRDVFEAPKVKGIEFAGDIADELAFAIAMIKHNIHPHIRPWRPVYWYFLDARKGSSIDYVRKNYWGFSAGGNSPNETVRNRYDTIAKAFAYKVGIRNPFKLRPKKAWLPERKKM